MRLAFGTVAALVLAVAPLSAQVNFDDLPGAGEAPPAGYGGVNWSGFFVLNGCASAPLTGYCTGTVSPDNVVSGDFSIIYSSTPFRVQSFFVTAAFFDFTTVQLVGSLGGVEKFQYQVVTFPTGPGAAIINPFSFENIDQLIINAVEGFVLDDISIVSTEAAAVPEPATMTLLAVGMAGLAAARRRRKA